jgi:hypothetical protein
MFLLWPVLLACVMVSTYWTNLPQIGAFIGIVLLTCLTTSTLALFCSVFFQKTSMSLMTSYLIIILLFCAPVAAKYFTTRFLPDTQAAAIVETVGLTSPFVAARSVPLDVELLPSEEASVSTGNWMMVAAYAVFTVLLNVVLSANMVWWFRTRWRVSGDYH